MLSVASNRLGHIFLAFVFVRHVGIPVLQKGLTVVLTWPFGPPPSRFQYRVLSWRTSLHCKAETFAARTYDTPYFLPISISQKLRVSTANNAGGFLYKYHHVMMPTGAAVVKNGEASSSAQNNIHAGSSDSSDLDDPVLAHDRERALLDNDFLEDNFNNPSVLIIYSPSGVDT